MKLTRLLLLSSLLGVCLAPTAFAQSAAANPLVIGQFSISRLFTSDELSRIQEREGWKIQRTKDQLVLSNNDYDQTYSVQTEAFANKVSMSRRTGDYLESYILHGSAPNDRSRIIYKIERTLEYPNKLARPPAAAMLRGINQKWGSTSYAVDPSPPKPGEEISYVWYFRRDGSKLDGNQKCNEALSNGQYIGRYSLDDRAQIESAESAICNAYVTARVKVDEESFVERISFAAYSNHALARAMQEDETMLRKRLEAHLDKNVRERRRVLGIPQL